MIILANQIKPVLLALEVPYLDQCVCHLFQNDIVPSGSALLTAFVECDFNGYAPMPLSNWGRTYLNSSNRGETDYHPLTWTFAGLGFQSIYGYYFTDANGFLVLSERNPSAPFYINQARRVFSLRLSIQLDTLM